MLSESSLVDSRINKFTRQNLRFHQQYGQLTNNDGVVSCLSLIFDAIEVSNRLDTGSVAVNFDNLSHSITMYDSPSNSQKLAANLRSKLSNVNNQLYTTLLRLKSNASSNAVSNSDSVKITVDLDMDHVYDYIDTTDAIYTEVLQAYQSSNSDWSTITREMQSPSYKTLLRYDYFLLWLSLQRFCVTIYAVMTGLIKVFYVSDRSRIASNQQDHGSVCHTVCNY